MANPKPFKLDMPFDEALERFAKVDDKEIPERKKLKKKGAGRGPPLKAKEPNSERPSRKRQSGRSD